MKAQPLPLNIFIRKFALRHARADWLQTVLLVSILGLGIATFLSIRIANRAAVQGFSLFTESLSGQSDWIVEPTARELPLSSLREMRQALGSNPASIFPVIESNLSNPIFAESPGKASARLIGMDVMQVQNLSEQTSSDNWELLDDTIWESIRRTDHLFLAPGLREAWKVELGETIDLVLRGQIHTFTIAGILPSSRGKTPTPNNLAVIDLSQLLPLMQRSSVDRVELLIPPGEMRKTFLTASVHSLEKIANGRWTIRSGSETSIDGAAMTAAFRMNLTVLSLIALLVGVYLMTQALDATVSRRRKEIATLRSLGVIPRQIKQLWLTEALLYGFFGTITGIIMSVLLSRYTTEAVTTTVSAIYQETARASISLQASDYIVALALGIFGSLLSAWIPANDAASTPPAQFLRLSRRVPPFPFFNRQWIGWLVIALGALILLLPPIRMSTGGLLPLPGFITAFLWLIGGTIVAAGFLPSVARILKITCKNHPVAKLAFSRLSQPTSRHQLALAGFFVAIGMAAAMAFLIQSFETTVTRWLEQRLRADLFISSVGFQGGDSDLTMPTEVLDAIESLPDVDIVDGYAFKNISLNGILTSVGGSKLKLIGNKQKLLWTAPPLATDKISENADAIAYANENFARRFNLTAGETFELPTAKGTKLIWISGIHSDYANERGTLLIDIAKLEDWYGIRSFATASVFLKDSARIEAVQEKIKANWPGLNVRQNAQLRQTALSIFHQTFAITRALQVIGLIVAISGLALTIIAIMRDSVAEIQIQRIIGMSQKEIALSTAIEGVGIALTGLVAGIALSIALGLLLIKVINLQSFGWTLQLSLPLFDYFFISVMTISLALVLSYLTGYFYLRKSRDSPL